MASRTIIAQNQVFGRLTTLSSYKEKDGHTWWTCQCSCGNQKDIRADHLRSGATTSCGCYNKEQTSKAKTKHGMTRLPEYNAWKGMKARCYNEENKRFDHYGGRGITVCGEWLNSFEAFYVDMGPRPEGHSIDRIDVNGNYEPSNCRWATGAEQMRNTTRSRMLTLNGKTMCLRDWADELEISVMTLHERLENMTLEEALTRPVRRRKLLTFNGQTRFVSDWAAEYGMAYNTLVARLKKMPAEEALTKPVKGRK